MSNFILTLNLDTEKYQEDILDKRLEIGRKIYNSCLGYLYKRYNYMTQSKQYKKICKMEKGKERNKLFNELNKEHYLTEYSLHGYVKSMQKHFKKNIDSFTVQKIATRCFNAFQKVMFHESKRAYFKRYDELHSLEGKSNKTGIRFINNYLEWNKLKIPVVIRKNDIYAQMALENRVKYCRIIRKFIKGKYKYYIQLVLEGVPPTKIDKETGEFKHYINDGKVGIDIGTQTIAIASNTCVKLLELAPEINNIEKYKRIINRKLDRSRRNMNPNKYNENGTINVKDKSKWIKSNRYIKIQNKLKELQRKQADIRKQSHNILANNILELGNEVYVEKMNYKGLQARAKNTTVNEKTGKINKKKRFGRSLANKAPAMFLTILDNKLKWKDKELKKINTYTCKASQYNHIEDKYIKKELKERWNYFKYKNEEIKIQRDLYSAFLIMNVNKDLDSINRELCIESFDNFRELHDSEILNIRNSNSKLISSMGV